MFKRERIHKDRLLKDTYPHQANPFPWLTLLVLIFGSFLTIGLIATARAETQTEILAYTEPSQAQTGQLLLRAQSAQESQQTNPLAGIGFTQALHLSSKAHFTVTGMVVSVELQQLFQNTSQQWQEGIYVFPLPEQAAVSHLEIAIGDKRIIGSVKEKQEAKRIYTQAKSQGKKAALVEQERPNLFTQSVANIAPGETVSVILQYQHTVSYDQGLFSFRFPMTLTPRYIPGNSRVDDDIQVVANPDSAANGHGWGWSQATDQVADAHRITPWMQTAATDPLGNLISLDIDLDAGLPLAAIESPYHDISVQKAQDRHHITTRTVKVPMDRDFELRWRPVTQQAPSAAAFIESLPNPKTPSDPAANTDTDDYAMLMLLPPQVEFSQNNSQAQTLPRQAIFIIDTSGSMQGESIIQAKNSLQLALSRLKPQDQFNIIEFNSTYSELFSVPQMADAQNLNKAQRFVDLLQADGGTEMQPALSAALATPVDAAYLKQIVFITDGSVGNEAALFNVIHQQLGQARLFTVGIGSAPNSFFMRKAAEFGRGTFTQIGSASEVAEKMNNLFRKLESPVVSQLAIAWPADTDVETWPQQLPDLYLGEPLLIHSHFNKPLATGPLTVTVTGQLAGQPWQRRLTLNKVQAVDANANNSGISKLWARAKIGALLDEKIRGRDEASVRQEVLAVALQHQLVSPYTSLVAVEEEVSRPANEPLQLSPVPNLVAKGQVPQQRTLLANNQQPAAARQQVAYPTTATSAPINLLLGLIALVLLVRLPVTIKTAG